MFSVALFGGSKIGGSAVAAGERVVSLPGSS